jgi:alpha-L-glutamate ligase-like protein
MLARIKKLKLAGVLGINSRNSRYIMPHNPRALYALVDDKIRTKQLAHAAGISVPALYALVQSVGESGNIENLLRNRNEFVVKPAHGSGGNGILVIKGRRKSFFYKADGTIIDIYALRHHIENILGGVYSLGGQVDQAIIEYRVKFDPVFNAVSYQGVPDIRVLIYRGIPAMAMLRLPTKRSDGRANLHQGAVGVGISLKTGMTTLAVCDNQRISEHPDFGHPLAGLQIPGWENLLLLATRCYELAPLGYLGVDIVLDAHLGPLILEMNARPGLSIQIANGKGLQPCLDAIDTYWAQSPAHASPAQLATLSQELVP